MAVSQQQIEYLNAMGIPVWISRDMAVPDPSVLADAQAVARPLESGVSPAANEAPSAPVVDKAQRQAGMAAASDLIRGLQGSVGANIAELVAELDDNPVVKPITPVPVQGLHEMDWANLQQTVAQCENCDLSRGRQQVVFGDGNRQAKWLFVGDVPRLEDEIAGQPMSGESGVLLNNMLSSLGVDKSEVYVTSLLKCRTPLDGSPTELQAAACESYLQRQIELIKPEMVVLMGRDTVQRVLGSREPMARLRKKVHRKPGFDAPMVATYHPFYLLSQPRFKAYAWQDLLFAAQAME